MSRAIVVLGHGSRLGEANEEMRKLGEYIKDISGFDTVETAFMGFSDPSLEEVLTKLRDKKVSDVIIMPLFLFSGVHVTRDIPEMIAKIKSDLPEMSVKLARPLGADIELAKIAWDRIKEAMEAE